MSRRKTVADGEGESARLAGARRDLGARAAWLAPAREALHHSHASGRLPHALLFKGAVGAGTAALAGYVARLVLCESPRGAPCGACTGCTLESAGSHPDLRRVSPEPGKKQIGIDAVRELIGALGLTAYRGRRRVGIVDPADGLNTASANALLKTLEEPGDGALLLLVAQRTDRLPATIVSRCQVVAVPTPGRDVALRWLAEYGEADWAGALDLCHNAPLAALELVESGADGVAADMADLVAGLARGGVDRIAAAEICAKERPELRLAWLERWATAAIYAAAGAVPPGLADTRLQPPARTRHIEGLFGLLDETHRAQGLLRGSANAAMVFEAVLGRLSDCVAPVRA